MSRSGDFSDNNDRWQTKPIALPRAHARGVKTRLMILFMHIDDYHYLDTNDGISAQTELTSTDIIKIEEYTV